VVTTYGLNGDMGHNIMIDKKYREIVNETLRSREYYIDTVMFYRPDGNSKNYAWLRLLGLMETWDMI